MARPRRTFRERRPKPVWVIACEDAVSAPAYFRELNRLFSAVVSLKLPKQKGHKSAPAQVVERAKNGLGDVAGPEYCEDRAWAIFDAEPQCGEDHKSVIDAAIREAERCGVETVISNPCYEHWIRLHIKDCDGGFGSSREVVDALKNEWRDEIGGEYKKSDADAPKLVSPERLDAAVGRAEAQHVRQQNARAHRCRPCVTELYRFVVELKKLEMAKPK